MSDTSQTINGELLRLKRESRGWLIGDMATRACMSVKQIRQLEEGGSSSFYSESVKITSAKKVGALLGLTPQEVFGLPIPPSESGHNGEESLVSNDQVAGEHEAQVAMNALSTQTATDGNTSVASFADASEAIEPQTESKNKTPLTAIAALFVAALAVAAWMRPEAEPVASEPPPPLQPLPTEAEAAASAASADVASAAASDASAPAPAIVAPVGTPASSSAKVETPIRATTGVTINNPPASAASAAKPL